MDQFFEVVSQYTHLSIESRRALALHLKKSELPKGHILVNPGAVCHDVFFIEKGLTRTFYFKAGKDVTDWLSDENIFACSIVSFLTRKPDIRGIELLEPSVLWSLHYETLEKLYIQYHEIERLGRNLMSLGIIQMQQRFDDLHFATAAQRYETLMHTHPSFIQRVPLGMIASYLGITQETLSRIRSQF